MAFSLGLEPTILQATKQKNNKIRKNRDWENMPGRAISKEQI
jgi:hypothetical protein